MQKIVSNNADTINSLSSFGGGRSSIDMENLFKVKEEYIFVFGKVSFIDL